jgi:hypothetical protein
MVCDWQAQQARRGGPRGRIVRSVPGGKHEYSGMQSAAQVVQQRAAHCLGGRERHGTGQLLDQEQLPTP